MLRLASIEQVGQYLGRHPRTVRNYISRGYFPAYRGTGSSGLLVNLDDVDQAMSLLPARKARSAHGSYGPKAQILELPPESTSSQGVVEP